MNPTGWLRQIGDWWRGHSAGTQAGIIVGGATILAVLIFLSQWLGRPQYAPLFTNVEMEEAAGVVAYLKENNVPYQLQGEGTILVPQEQVYDLRLQVAASGLLNGSGVGFELFDKTQLGMTDTQWYLNYQRALQEELRRTITQYDQIEQARVHLVIPQPSVFIKNESPAQAAVVLKLRPLATLAPEQVKSIMYLVASSVEGMKPENVRVIDTEGRVLSEGVLTNAEAGMASALTAQQQEQKRDFERQLEQRIQQKLEQILGPGNVVVMVSADLDFSRREVSRTEYGNGTVRSEQTTQEQGSGTGGALPPQVGDPNRQPPVYGAVTGTGQSNYSRDQQTRNYEVNETQEKITYPPGEVRSISTSVAVNGPLAANTVQQVENIVRTAVGYQQQRGDQISVVPMAFDRTYIQDAQAEMTRLAQESERQQRLQQYISLGVTAAVILMAFLIVFMLLRRRQPQPLLELAPSIEEMVPAEVVSPMPVAARIDDEVKRKQDQIRDIVKQHPEEAAQLVKTWLGEE
ncbi:MAG: flagellar M-ring protein FliF [Clostridia bacterium]|nr:MAG: flagellar M-ring protein FliF [Clostridia bacterium]